MCGRSGGVGGGVAGEEILDGVVCGLDCGGWGGVWLNLGPVAVGNTSALKLKRPEDLHAEAQGKRLAVLTVRLFALGLICYFLYGLLVGSYSGRMKLTSSACGVIGSGYDFMPQGAGETA